MHKDVTIASVWLATMIAKATVDVDWVRATAIAASVATAFYFTVRGIHFVWSWIKGKAKD